MRRLPIALLLLASLAPGAEGEATALLAALCDGGSTEFERQVGDALVERMPASLALIDALRARVKAARGRRVVARILARMAAALRDRLAAEAVDREAAEVAALLPGLSERTRREIGLEVLPEGRLIVWYDARTFASRDRLRMLEYLVCADRVDSKAYECLAGMAPSEWDQFARQWRPDRALLLKWRDREGAARLVRIADLFPWAMPEWIPGSGLKLGGNRDESGNAGLPPDCACVQVGVLIR